MTIKQAIEALELGMESTGTGTYHYQCMNEALTALRSLRPATSREIAHSAPQALYLSDAYAIGFRAGEQRILGEKK